MMLVRDKVPDVLRDTDVVYKRAAEGDRKTLLQQKLLEEVGELITANDRELVLKECADVIEVVLSIGAANGLDRLEPFMEMMKKREGRGGYDDLVTMSFEKAVPKPSTPVSRDYFSFDGPGYSG
jgi:predicted house-cleaning noncanonical NTP pyrophosphatase (MazG superfamily)